MRKVLWLIVCLMTMVVSANAQDDVYEVRITHNSSGSNNWFKHFIIFGGGVGTGTIKPTKEVSHNSFDMDLIFMNLLFSAKTGNIVDTGELSFSDTSSFQIGALIPIVGFGDEDWIGRKHKNQIFIAPLIGFISADDTYADGHDFHSGANRIEGHHCQWWISETKVKEQNCTEYGGAVMVKYGCGYLLGKFTNKSVGVSVGLCI